MTSDQQIDDMTPNAGVTISISDESKAHLQSFAGYEGAPFKDMVDAFRFAVSFALARHGDSVPDLTSSSGGTLYNMGSFDSSQIFKEAIQVIAPDAYASTPLTRLIRIYGERGVELMIEECEGDPSSFAMDEVLENLRALESEQTERGA